MSGTSAYSLGGYAWMIDSRPRTDAYFQALKRAVKSGDVVFDIGAGPGVFAILACRFGASRAVAIETDASVRLAPEFAAAEGCSDRLEIFQGMSTEFKPDVRADVIVADLRGSLPVFEHLLPSLADARERLLKPGGILIPARDRLWIALIQSNSAYRHFDYPWKSNRYGLNLSSARPFAINEIRVRRFQERHLLSEPVVLKDLDFSAVRGSALDMPFAMEAERDGIAHGFALWFDTDLYEGIGFSSAPGAERSVYGHVFFPFKRPMKLAKGERVEGELIARLAGDGYSWSWRSVFHRRGDDAPVEFRQATALAPIFSPEQILSYSNEFIPTPSIHQKIDRLCLDLIDGKRSTGSIAVELAARFPEEFGDEQVALCHVSEFVARYGDDNGK